MLTMDPAMLASLTFPHYRTITCQPEDADGVPVGSPLPVIAGGISITSDPPIRRQVSGLEVAVPPLTTAAELDALGESLVAGGLWIRLTWQMRLMDRRTFSVDVGVLRVENAEWDLATGAIRISALDLGQAVVDDRFLSPRTISGGTKVGAVSTLLTESMDAAVTTTGAPTTALVTGTWDRDRDAAVTELATAIGCEWYWDAAGGWVVRPIPTPATSPADWVIPANSGVLVSTGTASRDQMYNAYAVEGQAPEGSTDPQPFAVVYDDDPASPTYWSGPFGHKPAFYSSPLLTTDAQCAAAGATLLAKSLGLTRGRTLMLPSNPGLEPGDTVSFATGDPAGVYVADTIDLALDSAEMKVTVRRVD